MEDAAAASEASIRRSKRTRTSRLNTLGDEEDDHTRGSDPSDQSPRQDREDSVGDFEEVRPKAKRGRVAAETLPKGIEELSFIEIIKGNGKAVPQAVKHWVELYEKDPKLATFDLLTMFFEACGAKYHSKEDLLEEADVDDVVVQLVHLARNGEVEDYQSSKRKQFNGFKDNLVSFWDNLVTECQNGPLFDGVLFEKCMDYVIAISCTPPRVYRQVASLVGLQLVTSFITIAKMLGSQRETTQRQLNAEKRKRTEARVESLNKRLSTTHEKITMIEAMMRKIFLGLFVHRYRDIDPTIRMSCIQSLGVWILSYPSLFLQDLYLKYLGWTLNDKSAAVRKASVIALHSLYEVDDNVPSLGLFTERFSSRMIELADDVDVSVAVCAIGLVKQLLRHQLLVDDDLSPLYDLLVDEPPEIRRAIGELVYDHLIAQKYNSPRSGSKGNDADSSLITLGRMLQILREFSTDPILTAYVIDDVWEYMKAMKDWKCIISTLLDENPSIELSEVDATSLIRLLCASVKKAVGERIVPAIDNRKQYHTKAQKEILENHRRDVTVAMMKNYPQLLRKYIADNAKIPSLVEIILHLNLELYSLKRQEQNFRTVLQLMKEAFFKHGDKESLRSCLKAINFCCVESKGELQDFALSKLKEIEEEVISKLKIAIKEIALLRFIPVGNLFEEIVSALETSRNVNDEVVSFLLLNRYLHVIWCLHSIVNSESVSEASVSALLSKRTTLFNELEFYFPDSHRVEGAVKLSNQLACRVCTIFAESCCLFRKSNFSSTKLETLGFCPDDSTLKQFWKLCEQQLNIADQNEDEMLNREYVEEINRDAVMIAAAKLISSDSVPKEYLCPEIISHFVMHGTNIAEIVKQLILVLRKKEEDVSSIFLEALKRAYHRHMIQCNNGNDESLANKSFVDCKDLAARLSGTFAGVARNKHRPDILKIVRGGIEHAFADAPMQLSFLEAAVLPFASKLPATDIFDVLKDIQGRTENINTDEDPSGWRPYFEFVNFMHEKYAKNEGLGVADDKEGTSIRRRGRPRKLQKLQQKKLFDDQSSSEEDAISSSDQEAPDEQDKHENDEEEAPLIRTIRSSSKLRSLRVPRSGGTGQTGAEDSAQATDHLTSSRTSGASN
ncbi:peptidyl-prolyl cis-trans isomerase precursor [Ancistrocladus abbreviatus]